MTNYNDGKWHRFNGSECPVHPRSTVTTSFILPHQPPREIHEIQAIHSFWGNVIAFRVTKEYKEPREYWICQPLDGGRSLILDKEPPAIQFYLKVVHVREVVE